MWMGSKRKTLNPHHAYLDNCSSYHQFINNEHLADIESHKQMLRGHCNAGITKTNKKGKFGELDVWYNPIGIANILSLPLLEKKGYHMQYQTGGEW